MAHPAPHLPRQVPIDAYGTGGFRFADMSHRGSMLCLPSGLWAWPVQNPDEIDAGTLAPVIAEQAEIDLLVLGTGQAIWAMPQNLRGRLREFHIGLEIAATGPAIRIYNILLGERRRVAAGLIAVD
jgi:uncharacterized protein